MTQRKHEAPTPLPSPHADVAQEILGGIPLLVPADTFEIRPERAGAGEVALDYVTQMVRHHTGVDFRTQSKPHGLAQADINELAELPDAKYFARELRIANNFGNNMPNITLPSMADAPTTPRARLQSTLLDEVSAHYQSLPKGLLYMPEDPLVERFWDAFLAVGKTGVGKTAVEALACFLAGVTPDKDTTIDAKLLTSTQALVAEYAGQVHTSTFREFLGKKIPISIYYQHEQDTSGNVVVGCLPSAKEFVTGDEDFLVVDEGHNILGEKTMAWLGGLGVRRPLIATATPSYVMDEQEPRSPNELPRDLRLFCTSSSTKSIADLMEEGILNPTRVLEIEYDDDPIPLACEIAVKHLQAGERVGIYCEPGKDQPKTITQLINTLLGGRVIDWIASVRKDTRKVESEIIEGRLQGYATCKKLGEGSNIPGLRKAIFINPRSPLTLEQHAGRFWRLGKGVTELHHLIKRGTKRGPRLAKIIGVENIDPDQIIGYTAPEDEADLGAPKNPAHALPNTSGASRGGENTFPVTPTEDLPELVLAGLIRTRKEVIVTNERQTPTEGYIRLNELAATKDLPILWLQMVFDEASIKHEVILTEQADGTFDYERWYAPELDDWLGQHSLEELAAKTTMTAPEMAKMCETTEAHIAAILDGLGIEPDTPPTEDQPARRIAHDFAVIRLVVHEIEAVEIAAPGDMSIGELYKECDSTLVSFAIAHPDIPCTITNLRRHPSHGLKGITGHVREAGVALIRAARERLDQVPYSTPEKYRTLTAIARQMGIATAALRKRLNADEVDAIQIMRMGSRSLPAEFVSGKHANAILARLKPKPLPSSLVPPMVYKAYFGEANSVKALAWLSEQEQVLIPFPMKGTSHDTMCMTWQQFAAADAEFGRADWIQEIDFNQARGTNTETPGAAPDEQATIAYRHEVLQRFITDDSLLMEQSEDTLATPAIVVDSELEPFDIATFLFPELFTKPGTEAETESTPEPVAPTQEKDEPQPAPSGPAIPPVIFMGPEQPAKPEQPPVEKPDTPAVPARPRLAFVEAEKTGRATEIALSSQEFTIDPSRARRPKGTKPPKAPEKHESAPNPTPPPAHTRPQGPASGTPTPASKPAAPPTPQAAKLTMPKGTIPAHFVDAYEVLSPICSGPALSMLLRREKIQSRIEQEGSKRIYWIDPDDAELLKLTIESVPIAPPDYKTAAAIADSYHKQIPHLAPHHIQNLVGRLVSDVTPYMSLRRERLPDGKPGKFDFHYNDLLSGRIEGAIEEAIRRGRIPSLIRSSLY